MRHHITVVEFNLSVIKLTKRLRQIPNAWHYVFYVGLSVYGGKV